MNGMVLKDSRVNYKYQFESNCRTCDIYSEIYEKEFTLAGRNVITMGS